MIEDELAANDPARKAGRAARLIGIVLCVFGALVIAVSVMAMFMPGPMLLKIITLFTCAVYLAPGVSLVSLSGWVKLGRRGATIATLVIAILLAAMMLLAMASLAMAAIANARAGATRAPAFASIGVGLVFGLASAGLAIYCGQSLRFPDRTNPIRGFEPLMTALPIDQPETLVERQA